MNEAELRSILSERLAQVRQRIASACARVGRGADSVTLLAVTKTVDLPVMRLLPDLGVVDFGENRPQELWRKAEALADLPLHWHAIGHLQRNKIERTLKLSPHLIHSVDSLRLLEALETEATRLGKSFDLILEVNASREENKHGFAPEEVPGLGQVIAELKSVRVRGLMAMAAYDENPESARVTFRAVRLLRDQLRDEWQQAELPILSLGMSGDFEVAIEEGATHVRIGTLLFEGLS